MADSTKPHRARGEGVASAVLNDKLAKRIRQMTSVKRFSYSEIAKRFGVSQSTVAQIATGKSWRHV